MKGFTKRFWAFLMALVLLVGLMPVVQLTADAATVDYRYSDDENQYIYNWGTREVEATFLSQNAEAFYTNNSTSYDALASLSGSELYTTLQTLMTDNHGTITSYNDTRTLFQYTDCQGSALLDNTISSFYSGTAIGPAWDSGTTWNREHTWPDSKGLEGSDEDDIMMLRPTASSENTQRNNTAYGESSGFYNPNGESNGAYDLRGDVARIALYVHVRWGNTNLFGEAGVIESQDVLLNWMAEDPVDTWELGRNDSVESITGTRNVFVDYPELAFSLFEEDIPAMITPSGEAVVAGMGYTLTATSNDETMGTVSVSGNIVNAFPAAGYYAESYTVTSGEATVTANGNAFTVTATANCTVQINFAQLSDVQISYAHNGDVATTDTHAYGVAYNLPAYTGELPEGCYFFGWSAVPVNATETQPTVYKTGTAYTPVSNTTLHAVYTYLDTASDSADGEWTLVTDAAQLYTGNQVVIADKNSGNVAGDIDASKDVMTNLEVTFFENWIPQLHQDTAILTLGGHESAWTLSNASGELLGETAAKALAWDSGTTTWEISIADGILTLSPTSNTNAMYYNSGYPRFTTYASQTSGLVLPQLYVLDTDAGTLHYTTALPAVCAHENTAEVVAQAPTATEPGWTAGTYCYDCGKYISGHEKIAPNVSCTLSFVVPAGVTAVPNTLCDASGVTLPTAEAPEGYTFVGWTTAPVAETTEKQTFYAAGDTYKTYTANSAVLYALYSISKESTGDTTTVWKLAESQSDIQIGSKVVIVAAGYDYAMSTTQNTNNRGQIAITKDTANKTVEINENVAILTLEAGKTDGLYAFNTGSGYLYAASSSSNHLKTKSTLDNYGSFTITITDGVASLVANRSGAPNELQYNTSSSIFSCYKGTQKPVSLYVQTTVAGDGAIATYYTTVIGDECAHAETSIDGARAATCTVYGFTGEVSCENCGETLAESQVIPATGHASAAFVPAYTAADACTEASWDAHYDCAECGNLVLSKTVDAETYILPVAPGHDYTEDATTCGNCSHVRMTLKLTTVTLRATSPGLYYTGEFIFDEETEVLRYGIAASLYDPEPAVDDSTTTKYTEGSTGALISEIMFGTDKAENANNAKMPVYARAYVQLSDGTYVYSNVVSVSLRQMVQAVDAKWSTLTPAQVESLETLYENFSDVVSTWNVPNLKEHMNSK